MTKYETIKHYALKQYLEDQKVDAEEIEETLSEYDGENEFHCNGEDLLILDDEEADSKTTDYIKDSLWAFNASFISHYVESDDDVALERSIQLIQQEQCESANPVIKALIGDQLEQFIQDAIAADGRGHFISSYDGEEYEAAVKIDEKLDNSTGHPTFVHATHYIYIYRV